MRVARLTVARLNRRAVGRWRARTIEVGAGMNVKRFEVTEPAGVIRLLQVAVPHGMRAALTGVIPRLTGVRISTSPSRVANEICRRQGVYDVCTKPEEACPMPPATWDFVLRKRGGPAGEVRLDFVVA